MTRGAAVGLIRPIGKLAKARTHTATKAVLKPRKTDVAEGLPPEIQRLVAVMGEANARAVWRLQKRGIRGTAPELLVYDWLERKRIPFEFQSSQFGGRQIRGGVVTDFIVWVGSRPAAWRVQGMHWHSSAEARKRDDATKLRLLATWYGGQKFWAVCDLWEDAIYRNVRKVCEDAMRGKGSRD